MAEATKPTDVSANVTIYINNLNEKIKIEELKKSIMAVFSQFGNIIEVLAFKTLKHKGQAWIVFDQIASASTALRQMQGFPFYDKPMRIQYAKTKSDIVARADGTFVPREKRKRHEEKGRRRKEQHDGGGGGSQPGMANPSHRGGGGGGGFGSTAGPVQQYMSGGGGGGGKAEGPAPPNSILFVQNLPQESSPMMLQMLFCQYPGLKEVRMVESRPGIAFVEYSDDMHSTVALHALQSFKITPHNPMLITYAKK